MVSENTGTREQGTGNREQELASSPAEVRGTGEQDSSSSPGDVRPASVVPGKPDFTTCFQTLKTSVLIGTLGFVLLYGTGHTNWAWGLLIGTLLSIFSFVTLAMAIPFLLWPGAPGHMVALLQVTLILKMPIFCIGLYLACNLPGVYPGASVFGICLVPGAITLRTVGGIIADAVRARYRALVGVVPGKVQHDPRQNASGVEPVCDNSLNEIKEIKGIKESNGLNAVRLETLLETPLEETIQTTHMKLRASRPATTELAAE